MAAKKEDKNILSALSNPFSTGGGGNDFERKVQASFVLALLVDGFSPLLNTPVTSLYFQAKRLNWDIDDLVVISSFDEIESKLLCQIKHGVSFTSSDTSFNEVLTAAWSDFNKKEFDKKRDKIALITGLSPKSDVMRFIYTQANASKDAKDFIQRIDQTNYSNNDNRKKLSVIRDSLTKISGEVITEQELWEFCKVFAVLVFDLAYENSINEFLIRALVSANTQTSTADAWDMLLNYASQCNKSSSYVDLDKIPDRIKQLFNKESIDLPATAINLTSYPLDQHWAKMALVGSWNENNQFDIELLEKLVGLDYTSIHEKVKENYLSASPFVRFTDGIWKIKNCRAFIQNGSKFFFDDDIKRAFKLATDIFQQKDRRIRPDGNLNLLVPSNGSFDHSDALRNGVLHGLAVLSNLKTTPHSCSDNLISHEAFLFIRNILSNADTFLWTSLDSSLMTLAEIHPTEYLSVLEQTIVQSPATIEALFPKNNAHLMFLRNSICSVLWSIECLAWDERYFIDCIRILGELASLNYEKTNLSNSPVRSIIDILLPWHIQTLASTQKQKNAVASLLKESPAIAWKIVKSLLSHATRSTTGTYKPKYIQSIPENYSPSNEQFNEMQDYYSQAALTLAKQDLQKLHNLLKHLNDMNKETLRSYMLTIIETCNGWSDEEKFPVWSKMSIHKAWVVSNATEPLDKEMLSLLDSVIEKTNPNNTMCEYKLLFDPQYFDCEEEGSDESSSRWNRREKAREQVPIKIYVEKGIEAVLKFGKDINNSHLVASFLGKKLNVLQLKQLLKLCFEDELDKEFFSTVLRSFFYNNTTETILNLDLKMYSAEYITWVLTCFPLENDVFKLADLFLEEDQDLYWKTISIPYLGVHEEVDVSLVWEKLIKNNRPASAVNLFGIDTKQCKIPAEEIEEALTLAASTKCPEKLIPDKEAVRNLITYLHSNKTRNIAKISDIEFIYLPWLDEHSKVSPKALRYRLANEPQFFCDLIKLMYKKKNAEKHEQKLSETTSQRLLEIFVHFKVVPGTDWNGECHKGIFCNWINHCKKWSKDNDRFEVVMQTIGNGLSYAKRNENGLIDEFIIDELNKIDNDEMRRGFIIGTINQRGVSYIDPEGKPEYQLAEKYNNLASKVEELGYSRFAGSLRELADNYINEAKHNIKWHKKEQEISEE